MGNVPSLALCGKTLPLLGWCLVSDFQLTAEDLLRKARAWKDSEKEEKAQQALTLIQASRPPTKDELDEWRKEFKGEADSWPEDTKEWRYMKEPEFKSLKELLEDLMVRREE